jgi:hypothetical protein
MIEALQATVFPGIKSQQVTGLQTTTLSGVTAAQTSINIGSLMNLMITMMIVVMMMKMMTGMMSSVNV